MTSEWTRFDSGDQGTWPPEEGWYATRGYHVDDPGQRVERAAFFVPALFRKRRLARWRFGYHVVEEWRSKEP